MTTPTCWYCPECKTALDLYDIGGESVFTCRCDRPDTIAWKEYPVLVPGVDLPTLLRKAGHDVREGSVCDVCGRLDEAVGIIGRHKDRRHDRDGYSSLEHWCENQDGRQWRKVVVVLPDEKEAT